jgi:Xaa-Pro dipeptidase
VDELDVMWSGMPLLPHEIAEQLEVDEVYDLSHYDKTLSKLSSKSIHLMPGYTLPTSKGSNVSIETDDRYLLLACQEARLTKTPIEIELIQQANDITSRAHEGVMRSLGSGNLSSEYEASAVFNYYCAKEGAKGLAYEVIAASGVNAGTLHYIKNHSSFPSTENADLLLLDAGCEWKNYGADITRTFPVGNGGKFSKETKEIYQLVEKMQDAAFVHIRPGCRYEDLQILMHKTLAAGLLKLGILKGSQEIASAGTSGTPDDAQGFRDSRDLVEKILETGITTAFCGHGLGHSLGLDVHDSALAARPDGPSKHHLAKYLRFRRVLEEGHGED